MKIQKTRRERLYKSGKPHIREFIPEDVRWLWVAAQKAGNTMEHEEFHEFVDAVLKQSDRQWMLEDRNTEFMSGWGPVGLVMATFDGWNLCPHVEWFPWATPRNMLRGTVGFLQTMRYAREIGCIKVFTPGERNRRWFKYLKKYIPIAYAGAIPHGRHGGESEYIFYLRGRKHGVNSRNRRRRYGADEQLDGRPRVQQQQSTVEQELAGSHPPPASRVPEHHDAGRELHQNQ